MFDWLPQDLPGWIFIALGSFCVGLNKAGLQGFTMLAVPLFAMVFGPRMSVGVLLPVLMVCDLAAVLYYRPHAELKRILKLLPWSCMGLLIGLVVGQSLGDNFKLGVGGVVVAGLALLVFSSLRRDTELPEGMKKPLAPVLGTAGGFSTMIGNVAGPVMSLYFLASGLSKVELIGSSAWFFLIMNIIKIPFHVFVWKTIGFGHFSIILLMLPFCLAGFFAGIHLVKRVPEKGYRWAVIFVTFVACIRIFM